MQNKSIAELIEEARDRVAAEDEFERELEQERNRPRTLFEIQEIEQKWLRTWFKKKCRKHAAIYIRVSAELFDGIWHYWHFLQLFVNGDMHEKYYIREEAFDTITRGKTPDFNRDGMQTFTLHRFVPAPKEKKPSPPRVKKQKPEPKSRLLLDLLTDEN